MATAAATNWMAQFRGLTWDNVGSWAMLPKLALWAAVVLFCALVGWYFVWSDQLDQLDRLRQEETTLKEQYRLKIQQAINLEELRRQKEQVNQSVLTLEKQLPSKAEMDALLSDINQAGIGRGLQFELFRPGQVNLKDYYAELPITVRVSGLHERHRQFASHRHTEQLERADDEEPDALVGCGGQDLPLSGRGRAGRSTQGARGQ